MQTNGELITFFQTFAAPREGSNLICYLKDSIEPGFTFL